MSLNPDSSHFELRKLKYGNKDSIMTVNILKKQLLDSIGKQCTYLFELADVNIYLTNSEHMDVMPLPWGYVGDRRILPSFGLRGKYVLWDYGNDKPLCIGKFDRNLASLNLKNKDALNMEIVLAVFNLLKDTGFWKIRNSDL